jgi:hypothetical protein
MFVAEPCPHRACNGIYEEHGEIKLSVVIREVTTDYISAHVNFGIVSGRKLSIKSIPEKNDAVVGRMRRDI